MIDRRSFLAFGATSAGALLIHDALSAKDAVLEADVVVIGAGLAGLAAARALVAAGGTSVLVVEARDRVGGRTFNQNVGGYVVEAGGQWIGPTQERMIDLARQLGVGTFQTYDCGETVFSFEGQRFAAPTLPLDPATRNAHREAMRAFECAAEDVPLEAPWTGPISVRYDDMTLATWLATNVTNRDARELLAYDVGSILGAEPAELSLLYALLAVRSAGGIEALTTTSGGAQDSRIVGGSQILSLKMAEALKERVLVGAPVRRIIDEPARTVEVVCDGFLIKCKRAVVAMAPADAGRIDFSPRLPKERERLHGKWRTVPGCKVHIAYESPFWRSDGLNGQSICDDSPIESTFDNSPPDASVGILLAFANRAALSNDPALRQAQVVDELVRLFGSKANNPIDYAEMDWGNEAWTTGCISPLPPGLLSSSGSSLARPVGRIHWAGTETSSIWNGYMEGAVRSGERVADEVLTAIRGG